MDLSESGMEEMVTISKVEYEELKKDQEFLEALRAAGVDNWEGYSYAFDIIKELKKEDGN